MVKGSIGGPGGVKGLGGELPGQVHYGIQGPPGGHYIPTVKQTDGQTAEISFTPSMDGMPPVESVEIKLPVGTGEVNLDGYATEKYVSSYAQPKGDYALRSELPTVPTKVSAFENDKGYLTKHQDISGLLPRTELPTAINTALAQAKETGEFKGDPGKTPEKGVDYYTERDKKEMVDAVLDALPLWSPGSY